MKKIKRQNNRIEKREKKDKSLWIFLFMVFVLVFLIAYLGKIYYINTYYNYDGKNGEYKISKSEVGKITFYHLSVYSNNQEYIYSFRNHPKGLEQIYLESGVLSELNRPNGIKKLYVTQDTELANMTNADSVLGIAAFEQILTGEFGVYNLDISNTYTTKLNSKTIPITCSNVSSDTAVIYLKVGDETKVYLENGCIIIQGRGGNGIIKAGEKLAYSLLGLF